MDARLAIASRRENRIYRSDPVPDAAIERILQAGRLAGSGRNRQPWRFVVVRSRDVLDGLAATVSRASNLLGAPLLVALAVQGEGMTSFDAGRAAQNIMLAAWVEGLGSCPNGFLDKPRAAELLELHEGQEAVIGLSIGYPVRPRQPERLTPDEWAAAADRLSLDELVQAWL